MKLIYCLSIAWLFFPNFVLPQEFSKEMGKIGDAEINLAVYERDPQAEAVVLFDVGDSKFIDFDNGYKIRFTRMKRIKILTRAGIKYSEVSIPYYTDSSGEKEEVTSLEAVSYNFENGQLRKSYLNPASVYEEKISNRWSVKKFVFPDVKAGSIIEYQYTLLTPFHFNLPDWEFQSRIPTVYSRLTVRMIPFYEYAFLVQGTNRFDYQSSKIDSEVRQFGAVSDVYGINMGSGIKFQDMVHVYGMNNVPAFRDESYITSVDDYLIKMDFQLAKFNSPVGGSTEIMSTWPKLIQELTKYEEFGKYLNACRKPAAKIIESELRLADATDYATACRVIINYVKRTFKWDGSTSIYSSKSPKDFVNQKLGNSTDINLFMTAMLNEAGIDAYPVLISTRNNGKVNSKYPFLHFFNYVIVLVNTPDKQFLSDGTDYYTSFNRIPPKCINEKGLVIKPGSEDWVSLNNTYNSIDEKRVTLSPDPEKLTSKVNLNLQAIEFDSYWYRMNFENDTVRLKKHLIESGMSNVTKVSTLNYDDNEKPYTIICEGETEIEQVDKNLVISPFLNFYPGENRLTQPSRSYPIDLTYANTEVYRCSILIPEGYKTLTLPENFNTEDESARISVSYTVNNGIIEMNCTYGFKKAVYAPADYTKIKYFYDVIVKKFHEQIVLTRI